MRSLSLLVSLFIVTCLHAEDPIRDAVVKIHVAQRPPNILRPWTKGRTRESSGSGVIISGNRILTNAHVVSYANRVHVQAHQSSRRELAEVIAVAPEIDLAIIKVKDDSFYDGRPFLELQTAIPKLKETINVYGYPIGGEQLSITEGIISRIEYSQIAFAGVGVRIQIDAALNPGNSGGPALIGDKVVGLAFSGIRQADNIGYVIGAEEIERFLNSIPENKYTGKPAIYDRVQTVENESLRTWLQLTPEQGGLLITEPYSSDESYSLKQHDVLTQIGEFSIDRKGYVQIRDDLKLSYQYLVPRLAEDGKIAAKIIRDGKSMEVQIPVIYKRDLLIESLAGKYPRYFVHGPLLLTIPNQELIKSLRAASAELAALDSPLILRGLDRPDFEGEELVMLGARLFTHATSEGYQSTGLGIVSHINQIKIKNLRHAAEQILNANEKWIRFDLVGASTKFLIFDREEITAATETILEDEGIRMPYSRDLSDLFEE